MSQTTKAKESDHVRTTTSKGLANKGYVVLRPRLHGGRIRFSDARKAFRRLHAETAVN